MLRALWGPRLSEAIEWVAGDDGEGPRPRAASPIAAEEKGEAEIAGVTLNGRADRIDRLPTGALAIVDYKTGKAPSGKADRGRLRAPARPARPDRRAGRVRRRQRDRRARSNIGRWPRTRTRSASASAADKEHGADDFLDHARGDFASAAGDWLTGDEPFTAKLQPGLRALRRL